MYLEIPEDTTIVGIVVETRNIILPDPCLYETLEKISGWLAANGPRDSHTQDEVHPTDAEVGVCFAGNLYGWTSSQVIELFAT